MTNFVLIFFCLGLGVLLKRTGRFPQTTAQVLNAFVIHVSLPAVILIQIPALLKNTEIDQRMLIPISMPWLLFTASFGFFVFLGKRLKWSQPEIGALILTAGLGNTSFVGFPILESLFGPSSLRIGVLVDQLGTFLALSTVGIAVAARFSGRGGQRPSAAQVFKNVFSFPPFVALITSVAWYLTGTSDNSIVISIFEKISVTLIPLALVAVGFQLHLSREVLARQWRPLAYGLGFKLVLMPLVFIGLYVFIFGSTAQSTHITILESAMAPMITACVVAIEFGLKAEIATLMMGIGIPLSLVTVPIWHQILLLILS
jgi:predicted permease